MRSPALGAIVGLVAAAGLLLILASVTSDGRRRSDARRGPLREMIRAAQIPHVTRVSVVGASAAAAMVTGVGALVITAVPMAALIAAVVAGCLPVALLRRRAAQRRQALRRCWPEAVDTLVSGVRAGLSLPEALGDLARNGPEPLRAACAVFSAEYRATGSFAAALDVLQERLADPVADRVVASLRIARDVGGTDLGLVLRTLSALLREDARTRGEIEARQSWTVSAARLAVAAPWLTLALLCTRPEAVRAYGSAAGALVLAIAAALSLVAYRAMIRIGRLPSEPRLVP
ncbi:MAG: type II secretion system F family protein [Actinobacteria bacterium]|jgi:tight adherence protein B|nr:type II secretion system F family protein [Actinomycetota bacterium]